MTVSNFKKSCEMLTWSDFLHESQLLKKLHIVSTVGFYWRKKKQNGSESIFYWNLSFHLTEFDAVFLLKKTPRWFWIMTTFLSFGGIWCLQFTVKKTPHRLMDFENQKKKLIEALEPFRIFFLPLFPWIFGKDYMI